MSMLLRKPRNLSRLLFSKFPNSGLESALSDGHFLRRTFAEPRASYRTKRPEKRRFREPPRRSPMPVYVLLHYPPLSRRYCSNPEVAFPLSHSDSLYTPQEPMPMKPLCVHRASFCSDSETEKGSENDDVDERVFGGVASSVDSKELNNVCQVIDELFALDHNMEAVLDEKGIRLSHELVIAVLERFKQARKPAFRFFNWASRSPGFAHDSRTFNAMVRVLGKTRQFESIASLVEEMAQKRLLTVDTFEIAIKAFAAAKERKRAVAMFELMKKYNFAPAVGTFNLLLDSLGRAKLVKEAQVLFDRLKRKFKPNLQTYTILLSGWLKVRNLVEASRVWNEMVDSGFAPDEVAHNVMLEGLTRANKRSDAIKLFMLMRAKKSPSPNLRSYTIMIRHFCERGSTEEAGDYFDEMLESGIEPDVAVYTCLVTGFGEQGKMDSVYEILSQMDDRGIVPDGRLYNALIGVATSRRMPGDALKVYRRMERSGIKASIHTFNMMMKSFFVSGDVEAGMSMWDEMREKGFCADENSFTVLIRGLIRWGKAGEACGYIDEMLEKGMRAPAIEYNKFACDFAREGNLAKLEHMARQMQSAGKFAVSKVFAKWADAAREKHMRGGRPRIHDKCS